jgi:hypothetical protein
MQELARELAFIFSSGMQELEEQGKPADRPGAVH